MVTSIRHQLLFKRGSGIDFVQFLIGVLSLHVVTQLLRAQRSEVCQKFSTWKFEAIEQSGWEFFGGCGQTRVPP